MEYMKKSPKNMERGLDLASKPLTPKSERPRSTYGSLEMSLQSLKGACTAGRKCVLKEGHTLPCWPSDSA